MADERKRMRNAMFIFMVLVGICVILSIIFDDNDPISECKVSCEHYSMEFLKITTTECFCLDTDGKPREVPT